MAIFPLPIAVGSCANKSTHKDVKGVHRQSQTPLKTVFSGMLDKAWTRFTLNIWFLQNPPSPNERLSKGYRIADIKASAHASHKTHACISLKQRELFTQLWASLQSGEADGGAVRHTKSYIRLSQFISLTYKHRRFLFVV